MKVYLAAAYGARDMMRQIAEELEAAGHPVTARWLQGTHAIHQGTEGTAADLSDGYVQDHAAMDFEDIAGAEALVVYSSRAMIEMDPALEGRTGSGGRHVETGYALALDKLVIVVGEPENIFHRGACVVAKDIWEAIEVLNRCDERVCENCGNALAVLGYSLCPDCLEDPEVVGD